MHPGLFDPASDPETAAKYEKARQQREASKPKSLTLRTIKELEAYVPPEGMKIFSNGYLERGNRTTVLGQGGIGKSRLIMQAALFCRAGRPFIGWNTEAKDAKWLFIQTENGNVRLQSDLVKMKQAFSEEEWDHINKGIRFHTIEEEHDGNILLDVPEVYARVAEAVASFDPDVLVIDPLRDAHSGDLNGDGDMTEVTRLLVKLSKTGGRSDRALLVLHHALTGRAGAAKGVGWDRGSFGRNSKVLQGWARAQINIMPGGADDSSWLVVASGKCSNYKEFEPFAIRLNEETMLYDVDPTFDLEAWKGDVAGEKPKKEVTEDALVAAIEKAGGKIEKSKLLADAMSIFGCGERKVRDAIKDNIGGSFWETKVKRKGKPDAVFLELKNLNDSKKAKSRKPRGTAPNLVVVR